MLVTIVSECEGAAWPRTRHIIDAFLERIGERTWTGHLTEEGLGRLRRELADVASKRTAVAAHRAVGTRRMELLWIVGSARLFGPNGQRATYTGHAYDKYLLPAPEPVLPHHDHLSDAVALAGLWHDVGKANREFQDKLTRGAAEADTVRHEILSALAFIDAIRAILLESGGQVADEDMVARAVTAAIERPRIFNGPDERQALAPADLPQPLRLVSWLIATHHRLPQAHAVPGRPVADDDLFTLALHARVEKFDGGPRTITLDRRIDRPELVRGTLNLLNRLLRAEAQEALCDWRANSVYGRVSLILADRAVSRSSFDAGKAFHEGRRPDPSDLNANWETLENGNRVPKQSVVEHVVRVSDETRLTTSDIMAWPAQANGLNCRGLPKALRGSSSGRFAWQDEAMAAVSAGRREGTGFFGLLMAGTGAGKTRAIPKILSRVGPELRYTLGLSLRSLTLQAGTSYRNELGLTESEVATVIGDGAVASLYEQNTSKAEGSDNAALMMEGLVVNPRIETHDERFTEAEVDTGADGDDDPQEGLYDLPMEIARHFPAKDEPGAARMLGTPIVVCTIDQLMAAADARRTSYLVAALRLMSADLVLDEVDNFEEMDFVALGRLIYLAGIFGRSVLLSSATIPPAQAHGLFDAYRSGYLAHAAATGKVASIDVGIFGDAGPVGLRNAVQPVNTVEQLDAVFAEQVRLIVNDLAGRVALRQAVFLPKPVSEDHETRRNEIFRAMVEALHDVHTRRAEEDPRTRRRLSLQLIKVSHVKSAVAIAKWMKKQGGAHCLLPGIEVRVVVYHGAFPLLQRNMIEVALDEFLRDRHKGLFRRPIARNLMRTARNNDVMVIVIATGVEEVGRDHDFDGAVIEPSSTRSIIQCCGRIDRHRLRPTDRPNVFLLSAPLSFLLAEETDRGRLHYSRPGVEQGSSEPIGRSFRLSSPWLDDLLLADRWNVVTAIPRLLPDAEQQLVALEHEKTDVYLNGDSYYALRGFHEGASQAFLAANHADLMRFRKSEKELTAWLDPSKGCFSNLNDQIIDETIKTIENDGLGDMHLLDMSLPRTMQELGFTRDDLRDIAQRDRMLRRARRFLRVSVSLWNNEEDCEYFYEPDFGLYRSSD
jgi:CRISPR-associated endonuclease/helicase Cas3